MKDERNSPFEMLKEGPGLSFLDDYRFDRQITRDLEAKLGAMSEVGGRPLWEGYQDVTDYPRKTTGNRTANQVSTRPRVGAFFTWLVEALRPDAVVEFGTAFGASGMYFLRGLERAEHGHLFTYEPNTDWVEFARENLTSVSERFTSTNDTFEAAAERTLKPASVGLAFIDAIHTKAFVDAQFAILRDYLAPGAVVLFDDIYFSEDMEACWTSIAQADGIAASAQMGRRLGIVKMA
ncbi:MAG: class I SAM-dependent methyltransferase [Pseudomonadota bacterium]